MVGALGMRASVALSLAGAHGACSPGCVWSRRERRPASRQRPLPQAWGTYTDPWERPVQAGDVHRRGCRVAAAAGAASPPPARPCLHPPAALLVGAAAAPVDPFMAEDEGLNYAPDRLLVKFAATPAGEAAAAAGKPLTGLRLLGDVGAAGGRTLGRPGRLLLFQITDGSSVEDKLEQLEGNPGGWVLGQPTTAAARGFTPVAAPTPPRSWPPFPPRRPRTPPSEFSPAPAAAVALAEPDVALQVARGTDDRLYSPRARSSGQWWLHQIGAPAAWDLTTGSAEVRCKEAQQQQRQAAGLERRRGARPPLPRPLNPTHALP